MRPHSRCMSESEHSARSRFERLDDHVMHFERGELPAETAAAIQQTRANGGRVVAIGSTQRVRTLV